MVSWILFPGWGKGGGKEEENKKVLLPAFLVPKYPGSSLTFLPQATAVLIPVSQYLCSLLNPLYTDLCGGVVFVFWDIFFFPQFFLNLVW